VPKLLNIFFTLLKIEKMNWQEIAVAIILALAVYFLYKKFTEKDDDCNDGSCCSN